VVIGVERWAEIRRMHRVDGHSIREISRRTGLHRDTVRRALASDEPPRYWREPGPSKLDPFKPWIEEQLRADPEMPAKRLRDLAEQLGYRGGKTIFDDWVRDVRPRYLERHLPSGEDEPHADDPKGRLDFFITAVALGERFEHVRRLVRAAWDQAQAVKHRREPNRTDAGIAVDAVVLLASIVHRLAEEDDST
jgi:transposase